jgi:3-oxosteroid 1-dehydrogenase
MAKEVRDRHHESRRRFIKTLSSGALVTGSAAAVPCIGRAAVKKSDKWSETFDWICVGSGVAGCAGAIAGHDHGMKTVVLEKSDMLGGISSQAGGVFWVPSNHLARTAGIRDSREDALAYLRYLGGGYSVQQHMETFVDHAPRVIQYLHERAEIPFVLTERAEFYYPSAPGSVKSGRLMNVAPFRSEVLGPWRNRVLPATFLRGFSQSGGEEGGAGPARGERPDPRLEHWKKYLGADRVSAILKQNEDVRMGGAALMGHLVVAMRKRGIEIRTGVRVDEVIVENGRATGVSVVRDDKTQSIRANKGVLLATGGDILGEDKPMGWKLAVSIGGATLSRPIVLGQIFVGVPGELHHDGVQAGRQNYELRMRHGLVVNRYGERVGNESFFQALAPQIHHFDYLETHSFRNYPLYFVFDHSLIEEHGFGGLPQGVTAGLEWVSQGQALEDLARKMELPAQALDATVKRFNESARAKVDKDFHREPSTLGALEKPPFYGVRLQTFDPFDALNLIVVDPHGRVLADGSNEPIPGLYCSGSVMSVTHLWGFGYQAGHGLAAGATFGFLAAEAAAGKA